MRIAGFLLLAFGISWSCWIPGTLNAAGADSDIGRVLLYSGTVGPLLATLICLAPASQQEFRAQWWRRLTNLGGLASPAGTLCVLTPILVAQLAVDSFAATGGIDLPAPTLAAALAPVLPALLVAMPQELAWRGYALPVMIHQRRALLPTLLLAAVWGAWHLPLFFMNGTHHAGIGLASVGGLLFFVDIAAQSLLMTAFYLATRCTWSAILFHWLTSLLGEFWQLPVAAEVYRTLWTALLAGVVVLVAPPFGIRQAQAGRR